MKWGHTARLAGLGIQSGLIGLVSKDAGRKHIIGKLSEIPGVPAKIAQFLNSKVDVNLRTRLHQQAVIRVEDIMIWLENEHPRLYTELDEIDEVPEVASLSQVHRGKLKSGDEIAIKVRFPDVDLEIESQTQEYFDLFKRYGPSKGMEFDLEQFKEFFLQSLLKELDYGLEATSQMRFFHFYQNQDWIRIPRIYPEFTGDGLLVQSFVSASKPDLLIHLSDEIKSKVCESLIRFHLTSVFQAGFFHGDLHTGNWSFDLKDSRLVIYDFGSIQELDTRSSSFLKELVTIDRKDPESHFEVWVRLGFDHKLLEKIKSELPQLTQLITEPFRNNEWTLKKWNLGDQMNSLLGDHRWAFRMAGPPWFLGLMRSFQGVFSSLELLDAPVDIPSLFELITGNKPGPMLFSNVNPIEPLSRFLKVEVTESGYSLVQLEFPAMNASRLAELIPAEVLSRIRKSGVSVESVMDQVIASRFKPQELFFSSHGNRHYRIWLE